MDKNEVNTAFEILLEEIEEVFNMISTEGEEALGVVNNFVSVNHDKILN
jgi:hypothetical protein